MESQLSWTEGGRISYEKKKNYNYNALLETAFSV